MATQQQGLLSSWQLQPSAGTVVEEDLLPKEEPAIERTAANGGAALRQSPTLSEPLIRAGEFVQSAPEGPLISLRSRLIFFVILFIFHIRWWTFAVLVLAIAGFTGASYFNYSLENVLRLFRSYLVGSFRPAVSYTRLRPMADYGSDALQGDAHHHNTLKTDNV